MRKAPPKKATIEPVPPIVPVKATYTYVPEQPPQVPAVSFLLDIDSLFKAKAAQPPPPQEFVLPQPMQIERGLQQTPVNEEILRKQAAAAGWKDSYVVKRALEEAFSGLLI